MGSVPSFFNEVASVPLEQHNRREKLLNFNVIQWRSLKTKMTLFTLAIFLISIWSLAFYASRMLREDMERLLGEQQFSTVSLLSAQVNQELGERLRAMETIAGSFSPAILNNTAALQILLEQHILLQSLFNGGITALSADGILIADVPLSTGRIGVNYMDRDYVALVLKEGKSTISQPVTGRKLQTPIVSMTVPIRNAQDKVIGALTGVTDLGKPNFLDKITEGHYGKTGGYMLVALQHRLIVTATDKSRIMETLPTPGINPMIDRFIQGYEGTGVGVNSVGVEVLASAKGIPLVGWYVAVAMPTEEAFAPIRAMQQHMLLATIFMTLLVGGLAWWMLRRLLSPMLAAARSLATLTDTDQPPHPLPITSQDEIGELIGGFNRLLATLAQREYELKRSEELYRLLTENIKDVVWILDTETMYARYVSPSVKRLRGYTPEEILAEPVIKALTLEAGEYLTNLIHSRAKDFLSGKEPPDKFYINEIEQPCKDGSTVWTEVITSYYINPENGRVELRGVTRDITERKRAEEALRENQHFIDQILNSTPNLIYIYDLLEHRNLYANREVAHFLGYSPEKILAFGASLFPNILHPDDVPRVQEHHARFATATDGDILQIEYRIKHASGEWRWLHSRDVLFARNAQGVAQQILGATEDITDRKKTENALHTSLAEKEVLLKEVHHRVKNNLAAIMGLLDLQGQMMDNESARAALLELSARIRSMALVHEQLYQSEDFSRIDFQDYLDVLIAHLRSFYERSGDIHVSVAAVGVAMSLDSAVPCGLLITELVTNALKYAFPAGYPRPGAGGCEIAVSAEWDGAAYTLVVADNGVGLPADLDWTNTNTLGLVLVRMLGQHQLQGHVELDRSGGTTFRLRFVPRDRDMTSDG